MDDVLPVLKVWWQENGKFFSLSMEACATLKALQNVDIESNTFRVVIYTAQCLFFSF